MSTDHPRSRGEYCQWMSCHMTGQGSSPLSRGILELGWDCDAQRRIIPALAGNTGPRASPSGGRADHPRSRGEYQGAPAHDIKCLGSSPLSRGILLHPLRKLLPLRIIPALAGNTSQDAPESILRADHPRSRGEYRTSRPSTLSGGGSSPLSRGIQN